MTEKNHSNECECGGSCGDDCACKLSRDKEVCPARIGENRNYRMIRELDPEGNMGIGDLPPAE